MHRNQEEARQHLLVFALICLAMVGVLVAGVVVTVAWNLDVGELPEETLASDSDSDPILEDSPPIRTVSLHEGYVGSRACAECHAEISERYGSHPMSRSLGRVAEVDELEDYDRAEFQPPGPRKYRVERRDGKVLHHEILLDEDDEPIFDLALEVK